MWRILGGAAALAVLYVAFEWNNARLYQAGFEAGAHAQAAAIERWRSAILEQAERRRAAELERWIQSQEVIDELRARPAEIRERIRTITIRGDDRCESLPPSVRRVWNAAAAAPAAPGVPGPPGATPGTGLGDEAPTRVAAASR